MYTISGIQQGNEKAFEQLYNQYKDKLYYWLLGKMQSPYWAQEVLQQTFVKLWITREQVSDTVPIDIQLFRIARSLMIDNLRKLANERKALDIISSVTTEEKAWNNYNVVATKQAIEKVMSELPDTCRQVFRLSREQGLTYNEIANELSISPKTVEYHISKALGILRKSLTVFIVLFFR